MKGIVRVGFGMKRATMRKAGGVFTPNADDTVDEKELRRELKKLLRPDPAVKALLRDGLEGLRRQAAKVQKP